MLTPAQHRLLAFIVTYQDENGGASPTYSEMMVVAGLSSRGTCLQKLRRLQERGFIRIHARTIRGTEVLKRPVVNKTVFIPLVDGRIDAGNATEIPWGNHG